MRGRRTLGAGIAPAGPVGPAGLFGLFGPGILAASHRESRSPLPAPRAIDALGTADLPPPPVRVLIAGWVLFWLLMVMVAVSDDLRRGGQALWKPLLWEGTACLVSTAIVVLHWRSVTRLDRLLARPWRWFAANLAWLPVVVPLFVAAVYGLRHAVYAAIGQAYLHPPWMVVFGYESAKLAIFFSLYVAVVFGLRSHAAMTGERLRAERALALTRQAQLLALAQRLEPHFLFNALNTIAGLVHEDPDLADALIGRLATLLRASTDLAQRPMVPLRDELRLCEAYGDVMRARFGGRVHIGFDVQASANDCMLPSLALQPLLENAFKHGVERHTGPASIVVRARVANGRLTIEVEDDAGVVPAEPRPGAGLSTLRERLATAYPGRATFALLPRAGKGAIARLELPCDC